MDRPCSIYMHGLVCGSIRLPRQSPAGCGLGATSQVVSFEETSMSIPQGVILTRVFPFGLCLNPIVCSGTPFPFWFGGFPQMVNPNRLTKLRKATPVDCLQPVAVGVQF